MKYMVEFVRLEKVETETGFEWHPDDHFQRRNVRIVQILSHQWECPEMKGNEFAARALRCLCLIESR